ncbi:Pleckstrin homology domain-containing protein [Armillaria mellea]|nr:Pleckstrin homology domain-containing protein [Armillaria mellea]
MGIGTFGRRVPDQISAGSIRDQEGGSAGPGRVLPSHPPLTPTFTSPRLAPIPPKPSSIRSFNSFASSIFRKQQQPRASSLRSTTSEDTLPSHPFSAMHLAPLPVVSSHDSDDEEDCPVCLEPLSFSFRLPGEKPHIVPECGHALHEACFTAVYGPPPSQARSTVPRKSNLGVCGVCRRPMKVGDGDGGKSNKLAALTGMGDPNQQALYPGRDTPVSRKRLQSTTQYDPSEDDPLDHTGSIRSNPASEHSQYIVAPSIQVRPEFSSLTRTQDVTQPLTCIVVIELPGKRASGAVPGPVMPDSYTSRSNGHSRQETSNSGHSSPLPHHPSRLQQQSESFQTNRASPVPHDLPRNSDPGSYPNIIMHEEDSPFIAITEDLRNRIIDWKGHPLSDLGPLQMYDLLSVRRDSLVREFYVYLFKEALICVVEEKKRSLGRLLSSASGLTDSGSTIGSLAQTQTKGVLRLKGRIYVRHIKHVTATSAAGEMSLTIDMEDELASFILIYKDRSSLEAWKNTIQSLVNMFQAQNPQLMQQRQEQQRAEQARVLDMEEFGGNSKAMRMLSGSTQTTVSTVDSLLNGSSRSTMSSSTSHGSVHQQQRSQVHSNKLTPLGEDDELSNYDSPTGLVTPYTSSGPSNSLTPLPHPSIDLILVVSLPPPNAAPSTAQLKIRVIKTTLDFVLASLGQKDRLSLVTFEVGVGGKVRKSPFLSVAKAQSRTRLEKFIDEIGVNRADDGMPPLGQDEFLVRGNKDEKTDVVTAVNHGLDVVLQRKARNPVSGMILVSDASDSTRRAQMDLVLARAEAANVPIHSFGYGRSHDPASLWLMSNHTSGTYTFVKDWYDLRDCIAGCVGGMMSIGLLNMKLHMKIVDGHRFRIRKVSGGPSSILSSDGQNVDVDVGELRYGERKEMLIELELDNSDMHQKMAARAVRGFAMNDRRALDATQEFVQSMGLDSLTIDDPTDFADGMMDRMIDEVPVVEVDGSFFDPTAAKNVTRLAHPVLLTVTLLPPTSAIPRPPSTVSDPVIVRRRMELLASDMITRALVLVSRRNFPQAQKILSETKRILHTVLQTISRALPPPNTHGNTVRNRKEILTLAAVRTMQAILQDLQILTEALDENVDLFARDQRNFGAQQAMILRDQKSWSGRSATERLFWTIDNSIELVSRSTDWVARE